MSFDGQLRAAGVLGAHREFDTAKEAPQTVQWTRLCQLPKVVLALCRRRTESSRSRAPTEVGTRHVRGDCTGPTGAPSRGFSCSTTKFKQLITYQYDFLDRIAGYALRACAIVV